MGEEEIGAASPILLIFTTIVTVAIAIFIIKVPILIAKKRGLSKENTTVITILSFVGLLVGVTWVVALILSLVYQPNGEALIYVEHKNVTFDAEALLKLSELREKSILTDDEYNIEKKIIKVRM